MIELKNINKKFKVDFWDEPFNALNDLSFKIKKQSITGYLGANGSGKTTSLKIIMGFISQSSGQVIFDPKLGKNKKEILSNIGYLPERPYFYPHLTGKELVEYMGSLNKVPKKLIKQRMQMWSSRFKIDFALDRKIQTYSKGMLQRIGFVATLVHDPILIILDEPLSGLDPVGRKEIKDAIIELAKLEKTIFFSSHIVHDVEEVCEDVIFIEKGNLVFEGRIDHLISENAGRNFIAKLDYFDGPQNMDCAKLVQQLNGQFLLYEVNENEIYNFVDQVKSKGKMIQSISKQSPTLENILYNVREKQ